MQQFRWVDHTQPGRLVQGTTMLYISAAFDFLNAFSIAGSFSLVFSYSPSSRQAAPTASPNEKKLGYYAGCAGACLTVLLDLFFLTSSPLFGLIGLAIGVWIASLLLHDSSRSYARIWFK